MSFLRDFALASNLIEGISREPTGAEVDALDCFLSASTLTRADLTALTMVFQPDARLRDRPGLNVVVGPHRPPHGRSHISDALDQILTQALHGEHPYPVHVAYETLRPFTDGNGRSGRALWLWGMMRRPNQELAQVQGLGFLHCFYYQALQYSRANE